MEASLAHTIVIASLMLFAVLGAFDGVYFHMIKYKLHLHPPAKFEHQIHTVRGFLFIPIIALFFLWNVSGPLLWLGLALLAVDFVAELVDIMVEKEARAGLGGISSAEAAIHVTATGFRMAALAIVLAIKPLESFAFASDSFMLQPYPEALQNVAMLFIAGLGLALVFQGFLSALQRLKIRCRHRCQCSAAA